MLVVVSVLVVGVAPARQGASVADGRFELHERCVVRGCASERDGALAGALAGVVGGPAVGEDRRHPSMTSAGKANVNAVFAAAGMVIRIIDMASSSRARGLLSSKSVAEAC